MQVKFDRSKHVFHSDAFAEIIKDTIRFFNGTPVHQLPPPENFIGAGVYALYYIGKSTLYKYLYEANRISFEQPIYVGKAVPRGWRQARLQEAANELRQYKPIWNSCIDGFGNHDPGSGRYSQAKSDWDVLHPGRSWANKLKGVHPTEKEIKEKALAYYGSDIE